MGDLALKQWENDFAASVALVNKTLEEAVPRRDECASAVEKAQENHDRLETDVKACSAAFSAAQVELKEAQDAAARARSALADADRVVTQAKQAQQAQAQRLAEFQRGPLSAFRELEGGRVTPQKQADSGEAPSFPSTTCETFETAIRKGETNCDQSLYGVPHADNDERKDKTAGAASS